jgi:hypothetical protein
MASAVSLAAFGFLAWLRLVSAMNRAAARHVRPQESEGDAMRIIEQDQDETQVKGDITAMIDLIFLLLVFFILTTTFLAPEKAIASLMPTDLGGPGVPAPERPDPINLRLWPATVDRDAGAVDLEAAWQTQAENWMNVDRCLLQIGGLAPLVVEGRNLRGEAGLQNAEIERIHRYIIDALQQREVEGARQQQDPVVVHCFSGVPWKYALAAYDAVRLYEETQTGERIGSDALALDRAREVAFAPPPPAGRPSGEELHRIINLK